MGGRAPALGSSPYRGCPRRTRVLRSPREPRPGQHESLRPRSLRRRRVRRRSTQAAANPSLAACGIPKRTPQSTSSDSIGSRPAAGQSAASRLRKKTPALSPWGDVRAEVHLREARSAGHRRAAREPHGPASGTARRRASNGPRRCRARALRGLAGADRRTRSGNG